MGFFDQFAETPQAGPQGSSVNTGTFNPNPVVQRNPDGSFVYANGIKVSADGQVDYSQEQKAPDANQAAGAASMGTRFTGMAGGVIPALQAAAGQAAGAQS